MEEEKQIVLSDRELNVLKQLKTGMCSKEIAVILCISE